MSKKIIEYLKTIFLTLLIAFIAAGGLFGRMMNVVTNEENIRRDKMEEQIDYQLVEVLIDRDKMLAETFPNNYKINLRLGLLYEVKNDFQNAQAQYQQAIDKAPYNEFKPKYEMAKLYILTKRYAEAAEIMDKIPEKPKRKLIAYKADIFMLLGEAYFNLKDYQSAFENYKKSLRYYEILKDKEKIKLLKADIASSLVQIAHEEVDEYRIENAISHLENAYKFVKAPLIKYKLGVLYIYKDPVIANKFFEEVFKEEPKLINYETYYSLLEALAEREYEEDNPQQGDLYMFKMKKIRDYYTTNILSVRDLDITDIKSRIKTNWFTKKYIAGFSFRIRNISIYDINTLYLEIIVKEGADKIHYEEKEVITANEPLKPTNYTKPINVISDVTKYKKRPDKLFVEIYASKQPNNNKILLKTFTIEQEKRKKSIFERLFLKYGLRFV